MNFGPQNAQEADIFAVEELRADIQYEVLRALRESKMSQSQLARKLGMSPAAISQFLDDDANLTLETISKVFLAMNRQLRVESVPCAQSMVLPAPVHEVAGKSAWQFEGGAHDVVRSDTTAMLMAVLRDTGKKRMPTRLSNDNGTVYEQLIERVA